MPYTSLLRIIEIFKNHNVIYIRKRYIHCIVYAQGNNQSLSTDEALDRLHDIRLSLPG